LINEKVKQEFARQLLIRGLGYAVDFALDQAASTQRGEIEGSVRETIRRMLDVHQGDLREIIAADNLDFTTKRQYELRSTALQLLSRYEKQYHNVTLDIVRGAARSSPDPRVKVGARVVDMALVVPQILETTSDFCGKYEPTIVNVANNVPQHDMRMENVLL
jgi:hypothetical protein